jgi:hypothetical protein
MVLSSPMTYSKSNGCNQTYCQQHIDQHQRLLDEQLDWLTVDHDDLRQDILERIATPKYHPSMSLIDKWEEETIAHIRHTAVLARRALIDALDQHVLEVKNTLNILTPKLREARNGIKSFNENDIEEWATVLQELKQMPAFLVTVDKENNIHGLTIDLRKEKPIHHSEFNRDESTSRCLVSILHDPTASTSTSNTTECQTVSTNLDAKETDVDNQKIKFNNVSTNRSETVTPGGVIIIREQQEEKPTNTTIRVRRAHSEIPFDLRIYYPLRGPATIYK